MQRINTFQTNELKSFEYVTNVEKKVINFGSSMYDTAVSQHLYRKTRAFKKEIVWELISKS